MEEMNDSTQEEISEETIVEISEDQEVDEEISDDKLDEIADTAIELLQNILKYFEIDNITIDEYEGDEGELILDITGDDLAILIGRHGKTLNALQFLVSSIVYRKLGYRFPVIIDVEGYKNRQREKIESIAKSAAYRAVNQNRNISLRPMTPYERRIVHMVLKDDPNVYTESEGEGPDRHVVIHLN